VPDRERRLAGDVRPPAVLDTSAMGNPAVYVSTVAVLLTLWVIWRDYRLRVRGQADQLATWVVRARTPDEPHRVVVKNASNLPCTDVVVGITAGYRKKGVILSKTFGDMTDGRVKPRYRARRGPRRNPHGV
jgi:hypothetical protein